MNYFKAILPGIVLLTSISIFAKVLGAFIPMIGSVIFAIILGIVYKSIFGLKETFRGGMTFTMKKLLKVAIIFLGAGLSFSSIALIGSKAIGVILFSVTMGIFLSFMIGKWLKIDHTLSLLIGVGTSICGATAITASKTILGAKEAQTAYAISIIFFFNLLSLFIYPWVGTLLHLNETAYGVWTGAAIHDMSSAVAIGYAYGDTSGEVATTVKLVRVLFLIPILILFGFLANRQKETKSIKHTIKQSFPYFIIFFLFMSFLGSVGLLSETLQMVFSSLAKFIILMVMTAIGLQVEWGKFSSLGIKPLVTGFIVSIFVSVTSLLYIFYFM